MIEFPESRHLAQQYQERLLGKEVQNVYANQSPHKFAFFTGDPGLYHSRLQGKQVTGCAAHGSFAELEIGKLKFLVCDGTNPRYFPPGEKLPQKHQLHIEFTDGSSLVCTVQMYGMLFLIENSQENEYYHTALTTRSPLEDSFDEAYFASLVGTVKPTASVKALLATEQRIPGLGNGVLQDLLFRAGLHPKRKVNTLSDADCARLFHSVKDTLLQMTMEGGRDTEKDLLGLAGGYKTLLSAKTKESPCPVCGGEIRREAYLGGNVYFCPVCQPL